MVYRGLFNTYTIGDGFGRYIITRYPNERRGAHTRHLITRHITYKVILDQNKDTTSLTRFVDHQKEQAIHQLDRQTRF